MSKTLYVEIEEGEVGTITVIDDNSAQRAGETKEIDEIKTEFSPKAVMAMKSGCDLKVTLERLQAVARMTIEKLPDTYDGLKTLILYGGDKFSSDQPLDMFCHHQAAEIVGKKIWAVRQAGGCNALQVRCLFVEMIKYSEEAHNDRRYHGIANGGVRKLFYRLLVEAFEGRGLDGTFICPLISQMSFMEQEGLTLRRWISSRYIVDPATGIVARKVSGKSRKLLDAGYISYGKYYKANME